MVEEARQPAAYLQERLARCLPNLSGIIIDSRPAPHEAAAAQSLAAASSTLILVTRNATLIPEQAALVESLLALGKPTVVYAARNPYDLTAFPAAAAALTTYGDPPCSLDAAAAVLLGDQE
jgi:beta-N-acetylhexosaminidase